MRNPGRLQQFNPESSAAHGPIEHRTRRLPDGPQQAKIGNRGSRGREAPLQYHDFPAFPGCHPGMGETDDSSTDDDNIRACVSHQPQLTGAGLKIQGLNG